MFGVGQLGGFTGFLPVDGFSDRVIPVQFTPSSPPECGVLCFAAGQLLGGHDTLPIAMVTMSPASWCRRLTRCMIAATVSHNTSDS